LVTSFTVSIVTVIQRNSISVVSTTKLFLTLVAISNIEFVADVVSIVHFSIPKCLFRSPTFKRKSVGVYSLTLFRMNGFLGIILLLSRN